MMGWDGRNFHFLKLQNTQRKKIQKNEKSAEIEEFHILPPPSPPLGLKEYKAKSHPHTHFSLNLRSQQPGKHLTALFTK